ncbi:hypothetical protein PR003_g28005 [Phytophthora rubi]|uniref:DUF6818 domain-containing protein n=1 Tax=Phytophthora rubi TaxID=129364 RepID=A0A6A4C3B6_9STRA|nr:hypothetical protein PR003_g28005 [Phytophthora rubi]
MGKNSGSTNYTMFDIDRLLHLVEQALPLGRDEWERLSVTYNAGRARGAPERAFESLRRKIKMLYSARKPTGMPEMPPHIKSAKEAKQAIDEKANVIEIDDEADRDQGFVEPDFSFEADPDDDYFEGGEGINGQHGAQGGAGHDEPADTDESVAGESTGSSAPPSRGEFQELLAAPFAVDELGSRDQTPRAPVDQGRSPANPKKDSKYKTSSNRLGGTDLTSFCDAVGPKRAFEEDKETLEASFAKAKRIRTMKATTSLKNKLNGLESTANTMGGSIMETILLLREENERKAEARRADEEKRRSEERAEAKAEAEKRRHRDKMEMEERARRDREKARARTQELLLLIGALTKKD